MSQPTGLTNLLTLQNTIPLIVFTSQKEDQFFYESFSSTTLPGGGGCPSYVFFTPDSPNTIHAPPTFIGVYCYTGGFYLPDNFLSVNIQTDDIVTYSSDTFVSQTGATCVVDNTCPFHAYPTTNYNWCESYDDITGSYEYSDGFGSCEFNFRPFDGSTSNLIAVPDIWHHLLISWDLSNGCATHGVVFPTDPGTDFSVYVDRASKMWCSLDDSNRDGPNLPGIWIPGTDRNSMISRAGSSALGLVGGFNFPTPMADLSVSSITAGPISIPGPLTIYGQQGSYGDTSDSLIEPIAHLEMAELQVYTGITLDTSNVGNRRLFVDSGGFPVDPNTAIAALGKNPDILLTGKSSNWQGGINSGTAGNFDQLGTINSYSPGPQVGH
jgi:hypothetical protein